jgi:nucleotide-binding universal stress UspA family protein
MWTYPPGRILVPIDFGEASASALRAAVSIAHATRASVTALHAEALEAPPYFTHEQVAALEHQRVAARSAAVRFLMKWVSDRVAPGANAPIVAARIVDGAAASEILKAASDVDLVVMGTHGYRGAARWWMGSVAERVVRESVAPVIVVRQMSRDIDPASIFARLLVIGPFADPEGFARRYAHALSAAFGTTAVDGTDRCTIDTVQEVSASMLVIPTHAGERQWLGEQAEKILRRCTLPILFVPEAGGVPRLPTAEARRGDSYSWLPSEQGEQHHEH